MSKKGLFLLLFVVLIHVVGFAQTPRKKVSNTNYAPVRGFLNRFTLNVSTGYGRTFYRHDIEGVGLIQYGEDSVFIFDNTFVVGDSISNAYTNWFNNPIAVQGLPVGSDNLQVGTDSIPVVYRMRGNQIPIDASVHFSFDRYRFGIGGSFELQTVGRFRSSSLPDTLAGFRPDFSSSFMSRYYLLVGGEVLRTLRHAIVVDAKVGRYVFSKKKFNPDVIKRGIFFNIGVAFERSLSEYFKVFIRPSFEFKNYSVTIPETSYSINHSMPAFYVNVGVAMKLPRLKRCPIKNCAAQIDHQHNGNVVRSRMHKIWKWQDPDYGQNFPKLIMYKGFNKSKSKY